MKSARGAGAVSRRRLGYSFPTRSQLRSDSRVLGDTGERRQSECGRGTTSAGHDVRSPGDQVAPRPRCPVRRSVARKNRRHAGQRGREAGLRLRGEL